MNQAADSPPANHSRQVRAPIADPASVEVIHARRAPIRSMTGPDSRPETVEPTTAAATASPATAISLVTASATTGSPQTPIALPSRLMPKATWSGRTARGPAPFGGLLTGDFFLWTRCSLALTTER